MSDSDRWYVAVAVLQSEIQAPVVDPPLFDHQVRLLRAPNAEAAYERALFLGRSEEHSYKNVDGRKVRWKFLGLHDLVELDGDVRDGAEVYSFMLTPEDAFSILPKEKLTVFWLASLPDRPVEELL